MDFNKRYFGFIYPGPWRVYHYRRPDLNRKHDECSRGGSHSRISGSSALLATIRRHRTSHSTVFFGGRSRISHGQPGALLWFGGELHRISASMFSSIRDATSPISHRTPKIAFIISHLRGKALQWADSLWQQNSQTVQSYDLFVSHFKEVFHISDADSSARDELYHLRQGNLTVTDYALKFRTLAAVSGWNEAALITAFRNGLDPSLRIHLASYDDQMGLERFIQLSIRTDHRRLGCLTMEGSLPRSPNRPVFAPPEPTPMQVDSMHLSPSERQRRFNQRLCLYCGASEHAVYSCPI
ncbi:MAG: retrotransposon gag family protein, partial [Cetobacterium sp.]